MHWHGIPRSSCACSCVPYQHPPLHWCSFTGGVIKLQRASFQCQLCHTVAWQQPLDFLQVGAWPATVTDRLKTVVEGELLQQWDSHRLCNPAATLSGFLSGVQHAAAVTSCTPVSICLVHIVLMCCCNPVHATCCARPSVYPWWWLTCVHLHVLLFILPVADLLLPACLSPLPQALLINRTAFRLAHSEWKKLQVETRMHVGQLDDLVCPACLPGERALHGDGNQKLFTWSRGREASRGPYYKGVLFADAELVDRDMKAVSQILGNEVRILAFGAGLVWLLCFRWTGS